MKTIKLLIVSDTHGDVFQLSELVKKYKNYDYLFHLGDSARDLNKIDFNGKKFVVKGNVDFISKAKNEIFINVANKKIMITHGHRYGVKYGLERLYFSALENEADIVLFGHTHISMNEKYDDILFFNPGSLAYPRLLSKGSYGIIEISENNIISRIVEFNKIHID